MPGLTWFATRASPLELRRYDALIYDNAGIVLATGRHEAGRIDARSGHHADFFAGVVTLAVVIQCFILIDFALAGIKARKELLNLGQQVHGEVMPLMSSFQSIAGETIREARKITSNAIAVGEITRNRPSSLMHS